MEPQIDQHPNATFSYNDFSALEELTQRTVKTIAGYKEDLKEKTKKLKDMLSSFPEYAALEEEIKEAQKRKKQARAKAMGTQALYDLDSEIKQIRAHLKSEQLSLSDYLLEYEKQSGANQLSLFDGTHAEIVKTATIKRSE